MKKAKEKIKQVVSIVQLLPKGAFIIDAPKKDGSTEKVKGVFDMQAIENFCDLKDIPGIVVLGNLFKQGMKPSWYADFILCAIHRTYKQKEHCEFTVEDIYEWITAMGGFSSNDAMKLTAHGMKLFVRLTADAFDNLELTDEEKKNIGMQIAGNSSDTQP